MGKTETVANENPQITLTLEELETLIDKKLAEKQAASAAKEQEKVRVGDKQYVAAEKKMVPVELFRDNGRYKNDVYACVNGKPWNVPRGQRVEIPECHAEVIQRSMKQDDATSTMMRKYQDDWQKKEASMPTE